MPDQSHFRRAAGGRGLLLAAARAGPEALLADLPNGATFSVDRGQQTSGLIVDGEAVVILCVCI